MIEKIKELTSNVDFNSKITEKKYSMASVT